LERQLRTLARRQEPLERITDDATTFVRNWSDVAELLDAATDEERLQLLRHYVEVVELHADDTEGRTGTYAMRLFPEVRPDHGFEWAEVTPEPSAGGSAGPETTNGDATPKGGTADSLTDSRLVCISDGKARRVAAASHPSRAASPLATAAIRLQVSNAPNRRV
jgi:site-specific DNA recombinase